MAQVAEQAAAGARALAAQQVPVVAQEQAFVAALVAEQVAVAAQVPVAARAAVAAQALAAEQVVELVVPLIEALVHKRHFVAYYLHRARLVVLFARPLLRRAPSRKWISLRLRRYRCRRLFEEASCSQLFSLRSKTMTGRYWNARPALVLVG